jgi:hypothetical protein
MSPTDPITIPARRGKAARIDKGQTVTVINTHGGQVVDTWAFAAADIPIHVCAQPRRLPPRTPRVGTPCHQPTPPNPLGGRRHHGRRARHADHRLTSTATAAGRRPITTTADNLARRSRRSTQRRETPCPLNLFQNAGRRRWRDRLSGVGGEAEPVDQLRAEMDLIIVFSACPQDMLPTNGVDGKPTGAFRIEKGERQLAPRNPASHRGCFASQAFTWCDFLPAPMTAEASYVSRVASRDFSAILAISMAPDGAGSAGGEVAIGIAAPHAISAMHRGVGLAHRLGLRRIASSGAPSPASTVQAELLRRPAPLCDDRGERGGGGQEVGSGGTPLSGG